MTDGGDGGSGAVGDSVPPRRRMDAFVRGVQAPLDVAVKLLVLIGVVWGGYEYLSRLQSGRVEASLDMVQEWESDGHREAFQRLNDLILPIYAEAAPALRALAGDSDRSGLALANIGDAITGQDNSFTSDADRDADQVFYFFERAALCANERICDYDVLNTFLGEEARSFWIYFSRYAGRRQEAGYAQYGVWTARFAGGEVRRAVLGLL